MTARVKLRYFAWVREKTGRAEEDIVLPAPSRPWPSSSPGSNRAGPSSRTPCAARMSCAPPSTKTHVKPEASLAGAREIAFFPPVTGG